MTEYLDQEIWKDQNRPVPRQEEDIRLGDITENTQKFTKQASKLLGPALSSPSLTLMAHFFLVEIKFLIKKWRSVPCETHIPDDFSCEELRISRGPRVCCFSYLFLSDQICQARQLIGFQSKPQRGECSVSFWHASIRSPILMSGLVSEGVGVFASFQKGWLRCSDATIKMFLV